MGIWFRFHEQEPKAYVYRLTKCLINILFRGEFRWQYISSLSVGWRDDYTEIRKSRQF